MFLYWSAALSPTRILRRSRKPAWPRFSSPARPWTISSNSSAPTARDARFRRPESLRSRSAFALFHASSQPRYAPPATGPHHRPYPLVLEDFSSLPFASRTTLRLDPSRRSRSSRVSDHAGARRGTGRAAPRPPYLLPPVARSTPPSRDRLP